MPQFPSSELREVSLSGPGGFSRRSCRLANEPAAEVAQGRGRAGASLLRALASPRAAEGDKLRALRRLARVGRPGLNRAGR